MFLIASNALPSFLAARYTWRPSSRDVKRSNSRFLYYEYPQLSDVGRVQRHSLSTSNDDHFSRQVKQRRASRVEGPPVHDTVDDVHDGNSAREATEL